MITRRELLRVAGAAGAAALGAQLAPAAAAPLAPAFRAAAVNHISYEVRDYARSRDFYRSVLGMRVSYDDGKQCSLAFGDPPNAIYLRHTDRAAHVDHLAYSVAGFDKAAAQATLRRRGLAPRPDGPEAWTIRDPAGFIIQVCAERGVFPGAESSRARPSDGTKNLDALPTVTPAALHAVGVAVSYRVPAATYAKSRDFYVDLLGMRVVTDDGYQCNLAFGDDRLSIGQAYGDAASVDLLTYLLNAWDDDAVAAELTRRGLKPQPAAPDDWVIADPDGFPIFIAAR